MCMYMCIYIPGFDAAYIIEASEDIEIRLQS